MKQIRKYRKVVFYKDHFEVFFLNQTEKVKCKIIWTLQFLEEIPRIPSTYLKKIHWREGIYEVRVQFGGNIFRIFCFFNKGNIIVLANGFQKKSQKTPLREIRKAIQIKKEYKNEKKPHPDS